jgi:guanine deaminase
VLASAAVQLPDRPPFTIRARIVSPLASGGTLDLPDGILAVDATGAIEAVAPARTQTSLVPQAPATEAPAVVDLRPLVVLPGLVDLHVHLPQLPSAGLGFGMGLLPWLERHVFPLEREWADPIRAGRLAHAAFEALAAAGTTTVLAYGAVYAEGLAAAFEAAEGHGIRAILGKVMMDRGSYDLHGSPTAILARSLPESIELARRWHGAAGGRLGYAFTPRFAVSCTADLLRASAEAARDIGAWWQTHVAEDPAEIAEVARLFPEARDYVDVYDRAGGLGPRSVLAHAVHLSDRELARLVETGTGVAHCPASNLFLGSGAMPLGRYRAAGLQVGLGSDVAGGPELSLLSVMRAGAWSQVARRSLAGDAGALLGPLDWLRLGTLEGARTLGLGDRTGSLEPGKAADIIALDASLAAPLPGLVDADVDDLISRLIFREQPAMVRGAWVNGRRLAATGSTTNSSRSAEGLA